MVGNARISALRPLLLIALSLLLVGTFGSADTLYKYRGPDGEWIYADRPPEDETLVEVRQVEGGDQSEVGIKVSHEFSGRQVDIVASNSSYVPIELTLEITELRGLEYPPTDMEFHWIVPARTDVPLFSLGLLETSEAPYLGYQYRYIAGDPRAAHRPEEPYRAPFAVANTYPITQAYPKVATHTTQDSYHAVDFAMPIGTDIMAARGGVVFDVAASNFSGGLDPARDGPKANVIRILHDDGTYAIYAHLNTNSIRVRPGDRVVRGQYIADSGNTGFSSGPHLHFAVVKNVGMMIHSVPIAFEGQNNSIVMPETGNHMTAY